MLRERGLVAAVVLQEGIETTSRIDWEAFDAVFVGGISDAWKESQAVERLCCEARRRGKWRHMGKVNSLRRLRIAVDFGCQSVDGTYLKFGPRINMPKLKGWLDYIGRQPSLFSLLQH
jgi:hypothetical protein